MRMYDVIVIGGGPVGCYTAYQLAEAGFDVALFEEDEEIGRKVVCTGVIGTQAFREFFLPREAVICEIKSVTFFSPSSLTLRYTSSKAMAYVVNRGILDKGIAKLAKEKGVEIHLGQLVRKIIVGQDKVEVEMNSGGREKAKAAILATGVNYSLHSQVGLDPPPSFVQGVQTEVQIENLKEVEIYLGNFISPGSFAWIVPLNENKARIGNLTKRKGRLYLRRFLERLKERLREEQTQISYKPIAYGAAKRCVGHRVLSVGEAAGQVKTTTGGGIFYGLIGSRIAGQVLIKAFNRGDLTERGLAEYDKIWKDKLEREINMGYRLREILEKMSDKGIDRIFKWLQRVDSVRNLIQKEVNFDFQSGVISLGMKLLSKFIQ